ncbi:MAG: S41 family peptidase [Acidobacteriota bacterium]|nr:S41 family peptidase [Acidobacteriota bacterium]MDQ5837957.1 S41 family peptidase [Acidobacteriota bacterium]
MLKARQFSVLLILLLTFQPAALGRPLAQTSKTSAPQPQPQQDAEADARRRRREAFEIVWQTVKDNHFDPTFGGTDWDAVRAEFVPLVERAATDRELHALLQRMLNRLGQSHFNIITPESIPATDDADDADDADNPAAPGTKKPHRPGSLLMADHLTYGIGIDLRVIAGAAVITRVEPGSPAARAGLRPGFVLRGVDGQSVSRLIRMLEAAAVYEPSALHQIPEEILVGFVNGEPGTSVRLSYLDGLNRLRRVVVPREHLSGELSPVFQAMPSQFFEFESKRLRGGVGYIRFNLFVAPVLDKFCAALRGMRDAPGLVIDLRGNRGGLLGLVYGLGGLLETRDVSFGTMRTRAGWYELQVNPQKNPYRGQLAVLIDSTTQSAGEIFAGGLEESGRAVVVGERSAGATLPSAAKELPTGAILQYAFADFVTAYGNHLEGHGVTPDVSIRLSRRSLLAGHDAQLDAALNTIETRPARAAAPQPPGVIVVAATQAPTNGATTKGDGESLRGGDGATAQHDGSKAADGAKAAGDVEVRAAGDASAKSGAKENSTGNGGAGAKESATEKDSAGTKESAAGIDPRVRPLLEKFYGAIGGREAFARLSTRISKGTFEGTSAGLKLDGTIEILEKSPDKSVTLISVPGAGVMRRGFTGEYGYQQIPLMGFRRIEGAELDELKLTSDFNWMVDLERLYPKMTLKGTAESGGAQLQIVEAETAAGLPATLYFDAKTGLLVRRDRIYFEDYREVDGVRLPFTVRDDFSVVHLTEVKHNQPLDDARFVEEKNCFTQ